MTNCLHIATKVQLRYRFLINNQIQSVASVFGVDVIYSSPTIFPNGDLAKDLHVSCQVTIKGPKNIMPKGISFTNHHKVSMPYLVSQPFYIGFSNKTMLAFSKLLYALRACSDNTKARKFEALQLEYWDNWN